MASIIGMKISNQTSSGFDRTSRAKTARFNVFSGLKFNPSVLHQITAPIPQISQIDDAPLERENGKSLSAHRTTII